MSKEKDKLIIHKLEHNGPVVAGLIADRELCGLNPTLA